MDPDTAFLCLHVHRNDFVLKRALLLCRQRLGIALHRKIVLLIAVEEIFRGAQLRAAAHMLIAVGIPQPIFDHAVDQFAMAHLIPRSCLVQQIRGTAHTLHPAGDDDFRRPRADRVGGHDDGLQSGATDLIDGGGIHVIGQVGAFRRLPGRSLPQPRRQHISHDHFVHIFRCDRSPVHGLPNRTTSEFRRAHGAQGAIQVSNGSSHGRGYHGMLH